MTLGNPQLISPISPWWGSVSASISPHRKFNYGRPRIAWGSKTKPRSDRLVIASGTFMTTIPVLQPGAVYLRQRRRNTLGGRPGTPRGMARPSGAPCAARGRHYRSHNALVKRKSQPTRTSGLIRHAAPRCDPGLHGRQDPSLKRTRDALPPFPDHLNRARSAARKDIDNPQSARLCGTTVNS